MSESNTNRQVVIIGGRIIGCTTAYYLTHHPSYNSATASITIIEASVHGASGKAGGLVAKWAYPRELAKLSFRRGMGERSGGAGGMCGVGAGREGLALVGVGFEVEGDGGTTKGTQRVEGPSQGGKERKKAN